MAKILLLEDDTALASTIGKELSTQKHTVEFAVDIDTAKGFLAASKYDLLICDWNLPDGAGTDLIAQLRGKGTKTAVLMITGNSNIEHKESGFNSGVDDYLTKPFVMKELVLRTEALLRRPQEFVQEMLELEEIVIDMKTCQVTRGGKRINLPPREFSLLRFLMRHPNTVFSSEALIERVWPTDSEVTAEAVRKYIFRIREKLETPEKPSPIRTVHGVGYMFETTSG